MGFTAQPPDLRARIEPDPVGLAETATYTIRQPGTEEGSPEAPDFGGLLATGPEVQTGLVMDASGAGLIPAVLYVWKLTAPHPGPYTVGPGHVFLHGHQLTTNPVKLSCARDIVRPTPSPGSHSAAVPLLTASISPETLEVGQEATFLLQIENPVEGRLRLPGFGALTATHPSKPGSSTSGAGTSQDHETNSARHFVWKVKGSAPGQYRIGPASITTDTGCFQSQPVKVIVTEGPPTNPK